MIQAKTKIIAGAEYQVTQFPAPLGMRMFLKLVRYAGPAVAGILEGSKKVRSLEEFVDSDIDLKSLLAGLIENIDEEDVTNFICKLFSSTHRNRRDLSDENNFIEAFTGNYGEMLSALAFVLEVNFSSFFGQAGDTGSPPEKAKAVKKGAFRES
jgi:hypothetical protein